MLSYITKQRWIRMEIYISCLYQEQLLLKQIYLKITYIWKKKINPYLRFQNG